MIDRVAQLGEREGKGAQSSDVRVFSEQLTRRDPRHSSVFRLCQVSDLIMT